jgi:hypothetical protein
MTSHPDEGAESYGRGAPGGVPAALAGLRAQVGDLAGTLWAARGPVELMDTLVGIETLKSTLDALGLDVVRELEATGAVKPRGWGSTQDFVTAVAGGRKGTGPAAVRLAKAVDRPTLAPVGRRWPRGGSRSRRPASSNVPSRTCPVTPTSAPAA